MASTGRGPRSPTGDPEPPRSLASVPPPSTPMIDHSFTLQAIMELQKSLSEIAAKTDRLIANVEKHSVKLDAVRHQITFVRGEVWVFGAMITLLLAVAALYLRMPPR